MSSGKNIFEKIFLGKKRTHNEMENDVDFFFENENINKEKEIHFAKEDKYDEDEDDYEGDLMPSTKRQRFEHSDFEFSDEEGFICLFFDIFI
jgi:hypothetical protein